MLTAFWGYLIRKGVSKVEDSSSAKLFIELSENKVENIGVVNPDDDDERYWSDHLYNAGLFWKGYANELNPISVEEEDAEDVEDVELAPTEDFKKATTHHAWEGAMDFDAGGVDRVEALVWAVLGVGVVNLMVMFV